MPINLKKVLKTFAIEIVETIGSFITAIAWIAGLIYLISKTAHNLYIGIPACIIYVVVVLIVGGKIANKINNYFKT